MDPVRSQVSRSVFRHTGGLQQVVPGLGVKALDDIDDVPLNLWRNSELEFRVRGEDDYPWGDEYPHNPYFPSQFVSRSVLAGYVDGIKKKEFKFTI